jgi:anaphase-promoting complex subunit 10
MAGITADESFNESEADDLNEDDDLYDDDIDMADPFAGNVLKAMVVQVRICENHQNGKDTHVRGFQVFARDDRYFSRTRRTSMLGRKPGAAKKLGGGLGDYDHEGIDDIALAKFEEGDWLQEPEIR